jgi:hypothetical protein
VSLFFAFSAFRAIAEALQQLFLFLFFPAFFENWEKQPGKKKGENELFALPLLKPRLMIGQREERLLPESFCKLAWHGNN